MFDNDSVPATKNQKRGVLASRFLFNPTFTPQVFVLIIHFLFVRYLISLIAFRTLLLVLIINAIHMNEDLKKVLRYVEENIRVTDQTTIEYLDPKGHIDRLTNKQNQIVFGRRGSGKSLLLKSLRNSDSAIFCITVNLEDFKDVSFPDSIIQVIRKLIKELKNALTESYKFWQLLKKKRAKKIIAEISNYLDNLESRLNNPDQYDETSRTKSGSKFSGEGKAGYGGAEAKLSTEHSEEQEVSKTLKFVKLNILRNELSDLKDYIQKITTFVDRDVFLILDDFYFIRKGDQPYFADFFHRLSKNTRLYLKIATIKHRSALYLQGETYVGIEVGHDGQDLNLDYSLEDFSAMVSFMKDLLEHVNQKVGVQIDYNQLFTDNGFRFLCLASGGVPRDFFSLFITLGNKIVNGQSSITKPIVIETSMDNLRNKLEALKKDSLDEKDILEHYLQYLRQEIIEGKKWNSFLISTSEILKYPQINQAIKELVDLRLLHIANSNTSAAPGDGKRYSAYLFDVGLFPNSNPRNFQQVEPGQRDDQGREDKIRSAPKINLEQFNEYITNLALSANLTITE